MASPRKALGEVTFNLDKENTGIEGPVKPATVEAPPVDEVAATPPKFVIEDDEDDDDDAEVEEEFVAEYEDEGVVPPSDTLSDWDVLVNEAEVRVAAAVSQLPPRARLYLAFVEVRVGLTPFELVVAGGAMIPFLALTLMWTWRQIVLAMIGGAYPAYRSAKVLVEESFPRAEVTQWLSYWMMVCASLVLRHTVGFSLLPPVFYIKAAMLGWLVSADTLGAKVIWDVALAPLIKSCFKPKETCMTLVATGLRRRHRRSACFFPGWRRLA